jgi:hypothetical protein
VYPSFIVYDFNNNKINSFFVTNFTAKEMKEVCVCVRVCERERARDCDLPAVQSSQLVALLLDAYFPTAQAVQIIEDAELEYLPPEHSVQEEARTGLYVPAKHAPQVVARSALYLPAAQEVQAVAPVTLLVASPA